MKAEGKKERAREGGRQREKVSNRIPLDGERDNLSEEERCHLHCEHTLITPSLPASSTPSPTPSLPPSLPVSLPRSLRHSITLSPLLRVCAGPSLTSRTHTHLSPSLTLCLGTYHTHLQFPSYACSSYPSLPLTFSSLSLLFFYCLSQPACPPQFLFFASHYHPPICSRSLIDRKSVV